MSRDKATHSGPSWRELDRSYASETLYALIEPNKNSTDKRRFPIKVTRLSAFSPSSGFFVDGTTPNGEKIELYGYSAPRSEGSCVFEVLEVEVS